MAARHGATIIPVSAVGLEDSLALLLDSDDIRNSLLWSEWGEKGEGQGQGGLVGGGGGEAEGAGAGVAHSSPRIHPC